MITIVAIIFLVAVWAAFFAFGSWLFMIVWNFVMPAVFHLALLNFWQAAAIVFLLGFIGRAISSRSKD